jgi:phage tail protein X
MTTQNVETYVVEGEVMLDNIIWRRYRRQTPGLLERTLDINPGLAALGPFIPHGTVILLPIEPAQATRVVPVIKLWD